MIAAIGENDIEPDVFDHDWAGGSNARRMSFKVFKSMIAALEELLD